MRYAVVDTVTGKLTRWGTCPDDQMAAQAGAGELALDISDISDWSSDERDYHYSGNEVARRVALTCSIPGGASVGAGVTVSAPSGAAITIDGTEVGTVGSSNSETVTFTDAGTYQVALSLWPYLDVTQSVAVS